jgi:hypothetical protein
VQFEGMLSPQELLDLVTNRTSHFKLDAFVVGGDGAKFDAGKPIQISAVSGEKGHLYVFDIGPEGDLSLVFPLRGENNVVEKGKQFDVPPRLLASGHGQHDLKSIVLPKPIALTGFSGPPEPQPQTGDQGQKPNQTNPKPPPKPSIQPQQLRVNYTTHRRFRGRLLGFFRKDVSKDSPVPAKIERFAQDSTSYFVFDAKKPAPAPQPGGENR